MKRKIPVIVTLNADRLNSAEVGLGYGTDTGTRLRGQYRRAIVNKRGHSFDANLELSQIRQSIDGRYNIPYNHPLNDYISIVGGYEREERDGVAQGDGLLIESAVLGADRIIKNPRANWQQTYGLRYRLDRLTQDGSVDFSQIPEAFRFNTEDEQQSLLVGYEVSRTDSDRRVNPTKGFKQTYKVELGSEALLSDADMAIVNAGWRFIYSLGENADHQFVGRADLGYIFTEDFAKVPYNLRYFSGGDQSIQVSTIRVFLRKLKALKWADRLWVWLHWSIIISSGRAGALQYLRMPEMPIMRILVIRQNMVRAGDSLGFTDWPNSFRCGDRTVG